MKVEGTRDGALNCRSSTYGMEGWKEPSHDAVVSDRRLSCVIEYLVGRQTQDW